MDSHSRFAFQGLIVPGLNPCSYPPLYPNPRASRLSKNIVRPQTGTVMNSLSGAGGEDRSHQHQHQNQQIHKHQDQHQHRHALHTHDTPQTRKLAVQILASKPEKRFFTDNRTVIIKKEKAKQVMEDYASFLSKSENVQQFGAANVYLSDDSQSLVCYNDKTNATSAQTIPSASVSSSVSTSVPATQSTGKKSGVLSILASNPSVGMVSTNRTKIDVNHQANQVMQDYTAFLASQQDPQKMNANVYYIKHSNSLICFHDEKDKDGSINKSP